MERQSITIGVRLMGVVSILCRIFTSWYVLTPAVFWFAYFKVQEDFGPSLILTIIFGVVSYKTWKDYDPVADGQITLKELFGKKD